MPATKTRAKAAEKEARKQELARARARMKKAREAKVKKEGKKSKRKYTKPRKPIGMEALGTAWNPREGKYTKYYFEAPNSIAKKEYVLGNTLMIPCKSIKDCAKKYAKARRNMQKARTSMGRK